MKQFIRPLIQYFITRLPDSSPSDKYLLPYVSLWSSLVLKSRKPLIIGITGTAGKTTTTQMLGHILMQESSRRYVGDVAKTQGNRNGDYGLRLSILQESLYPYNRLKRLELVISLPFQAIKQAFISRYPKILVLEYGTYERGHIHDLVKHAPAKIAVVTNIGAAHLERHKTEEGVYIEKRALVKGVPLDGLIILGSGHQFVASLQEDAKAPVIVVDGRGIALAQEISRTICLHLGLPEKVINEGLQSYQPPKSRLTHFNTAGMSVIDDSYNANPLSMKLGIDTLVEYRKEGSRLVTILGKMAELGDLTRHYHKEIGTYARERVDLIVGVGEEAKDYAPDLWFASSEQCAEGIQSIIRTGDVVLIKGSLSANMSIIVKTIKN